MPSIYIDDNYRNVCSKWYQLWRRFHQMVARFFPPDFIYIVWAYDRKEEGASPWLYGVYLHRSHAEKAVVSHLRRVPQGHAEWEQRGVRDEELEVDGGRVR